MTLVRVDHVQLAMPEGGEDEARRFYADALGLSETPNSAPRGAVWFEGGNGLRVHLGVERDFRPPEGCIRRSLCPACATSRPISAHAASR